MATLRTPIISVVIGEGGSGGALAIGVCDRLLMMQYATYSVISPEGCASILWKSQDKKEAAAEALNLTADRLHDLGLVDEVLTEPLGGAHRDAPAMAMALRTAVERHFDELERLSLDELLKQREQRLAGFGSFSESEA
jgi:acetyl-CoA carboxylase carboxyl transferase subunit alpha